MVPRYLWWALHAHIADLRAVAVGSTYEAVTADAVGSLLIETRSLRTQQSISDYIDVETARMEALFDIRRQTGQLLEERWQSLMHAGISGLLTDAGARRASTLPWIESLPTRWREAKLTLFARLGSGHTPSRSHPEWWENPSIPWITTGEVGQVRNDRVEFITETREMISEEGLANSAAALHPKGTVVLCRTASAGYSAIMGADMATSQDFATWTCGPHLRPRFLLLCLRVMRQDLLGRLAMGSTHQTIYMPDIEGIRIPLPPLDEQDVIVEAVYSKLPALNKAIQGLARQMQLLEERRNALVTAVVTGELEIPKAAA